MSINLPPGYLEVIFLFYLFKQMRAEFLEEKEKKLGNVCDIYRAETRQWPPGWQQTQHKKLPLFKFYYTIN